MEKIMILQKMLFPRKDICEEQAMYFNGNNIETGEGGVVIKNGGILDTGDRSLSKMTMVAPTFSQ